MPIAISGPSGSGKTCSALLMAAGLAGETGKVALIDTENGRGKLFADSPIIKAAIPNGYLYGELPAPFSPSRYIAAIDCAEREGVTVCVIDSGSHEWEGPGGCEEIAETAKKKWATAKGENRKYVYRLLYSPMHIIVCLRAREKTKIIKGTNEHISLGILPVCEKNFMFEMLLSLQLEDKTHFAMPVKVPDGLRDAFPGGRMLTREDGERIRQWIESGSNVDAIERLKKRARLVAEEGTAAYAEFFGSLTKEQRKGLASAHAENKSVAEAADKLASQSADTAQRDLGSIASLPDPLDYPAGTRATSQEKAYEVHDTDEGPKWIPLVEAVAERLRA